MADDAKPYELTRNPMDGTWGFICREHGVHRHGLAERHATNVEAKHLREDHAVRADGMLDLSATAQAFLTIRRKALGRPPTSDYGQRADVALALWETLTGKQGRDAVEYAEAIVGRGVTAATLPF